MTGLNLVLTKLSEIEKITSRTGKEILWNEILAEPIAAQVLKEMVQYTAHHFWNYYTTPTKKYAAEPRTLAADESCNVLWEGMRKLLDLLRDRAVTGGAAKRILDDYLDGMPAFYAHWLSRVILRDLKVGVATKTFEKTWPELFPIFSPALCDTWEGEHLSKPHYAEPKLDGFRILTLKEAGNVVMISREAKPYYNTDDLIEIVKQFPLDNIVLDGEGWAGDWSTTAHIMRSQSGISAEERAKLKLHCFDIMLLQDWNRRRCAEPLHARKGTLAAYIDNANRYVGSNRLVLVPHVMVQTPDEIQEEMARQVKLGWEGIVIKDPDAPYSFDRTSSWLKFKPVTDANLKVVGVTEGEGAIAGMLGALILEGEVLYKKKKYFVKTRAGSGLTHADRIELWSLHKEGKLIGKTVELKFQEVTSEIGASSSISLRFPIFKRIRWDIL